MERCDSGLDAFSWDTVTPFSTSLFCEKMSDRRTKKRWTKDGQGRYLRKTCLGEGRGITEENAGHIGGLNIGTRSPITPRICFPSNPHRAAVPQSVPLLPLKEWRRSSNPTSQSDVCNCEEWALPACLRLLWLYLGLSCGVAKAGSPIGSRRRCGGNIEGLVKKHGQTSVHYTTNEVWRNIVSNLQEEQEENVKTLPVLRTRASYVVHIQLYSEFNSVTGQSDRGVSNQEADVGCRDGRRGRRTRKQHQSSAGRS